MEAKSYLSVLDRAFDEQTWATAALMSEYITHCQVLIESVNESAHETGDSGDVSSHIVRNIEKNWLAELMVRHYTGDIDLETIYDQTKLDNVLKTARLEVQDH